MIKPLNKITVLLQAHVNMVRTDNGTEFKNQVLQEYFNSVGISHQASSVRTPQQNGVVEQRNCTLVEAARTMLIFSRASLFLWAEAIATATFDEASSNGFEQSSLKPEKLQSMDFWQISLGHTAHLCTINKNHSQPLTGIGYIVRRLCMMIHWRSTVRCYTERNPVAQAPQVLQTPTASTTIANTTPTPTTSSSQATNIPNTSPDVDELDIQQEYVQQQNNQASL
ncbi:retrovirus-related pol polyprotein from transposon TNT 1-94 [Tanacetum coccineum]